MATGLLVFDIIIFAGTLWLGLYLIGRDRRNPRLCLSGLGLVSYALGWALDIAGRAAPTLTLERTLADARWPLYSLPALFWTGALVYLLPDEAPLRRRLGAIWRYGVVPVAVLCYLAGEIGGLPLDVTADGPRLSVANLVVSIVVLAPLLLAAGLVWRAIRSAQPRNAGGILLTCTLFITLGTGLLLLPAWLPRSWVLLLLGGDLVLLGVAIAWLDAFDQGEAFLPDFVRSLDVSLLTALLFGGQVALVMILATGATFALVVLVLATIATAIAIQAFADGIQGLVDRLAFARRPRLRRTRADLRATAGALPRVNPALDLQALDEAAFIRLTRRALSHFGDLPRLATSPLIYLPLIDRRLAERDAPDDPLERAVELKAVLEESITRLKPRGQGGFGTTDEWRHYNALYFPYVAGLKPYSRRAPHNGHDPIAGEALAWFRGYVPERTLYNWQTAGTQLVARDLRLRGGAGAAS